MDIKSSMSSLRTSSNRSLGSDLAANVSGSSSPFFMYSAALILPRLNPSSRRQPSDMTYAAKMMPPCFVTRMASPSAWRLSFFVYRWYKGPNSSVMSYWLSEKADKSSALPWVIVICSAGSAWL